MPDTSSIELCSTVENIQGLRNAWEQMQHHPNADIDFYLSILKSRPKILRPHILTLMDAGNPKAMMIGRIEDRELTSRIGYKTIYSHRVRLLVIIYGGLLGDFSSNTTDKFVSELLCFLERGEVDAISLSHAPINSRLFQLMRESPFFICRDYLPCENVHWQMSLPQTFEEFFARMSAHRRHELRRYPRVLRNKFSGKVAFKSYNSIDDVDVISHDAEMIAQTTYHRGLGVGFIDNIENRRRLKLFAQKGLMRAYILYIEDQPSAFWIGTAYGEVFHLDFTGYDHELRKYEIGTISFLEMVEDLCSVGIKKVDFGFGDALYKSRFGDTSFRESSVYVFAPTFTGVKLNIMLTMLNSLTRSTQYFFDKTKLSQKIKKYWRRLLIRNDNNN